MTLIHLQMVLLTCAKSILPSTFLAMNPDWRDLTDEIDVNATLVELTAGPPLSRG